MTKGMVMVAFQPLKEKISLSNISACKIRCIVFFALSCSSVFSYAGDEPTVDNFKKEYAEYQKYSQEGKWEDSLPYAEKSYEIGKSLFGESSKNTASLAYNYGLNLMSLRKDKDAEKVLKEALRLYEGVHGKKSEQLIPVLMDFGHSMAAPYQKNTQKKHYNRALRLAEAHYGEGSLNWAQLSVEAGTNIMQRAYSTEARKYLYQGYAVLEEKFGEASPGTGYAAFQIGKFELATKDYDEAIVYLNKALASFTLPDEPSSTIELATHGFLVHAYEKSEQQDSATKHCLAIGRMTPATSLQDYKPLVKIAPKYPASAANRGQEGFVTVEYEVDDFGFVRDPKVVDMSGSDSFVDVAIEAAKKFRYAPAFKDGKAVKTAGVQNKFTFKMAK
jgi:TonB family protein